MLLHVEMAHKKDGKHPCIDCDYRAEDLKDFWTHHNAVHGRKNPYRCDLCFVILHTPMRIYGHVKGEHEREMSGEKLSSKAGKRRTCPEPNCNYWCFGESFLNMHRNKVHFVEGIPFKCKSCDFETPKVKEMTSHCQATHPDLKRPLVCNECHLDFVSRKNLQIHKRTAHAEKVFVCDYDGCSSKYGSQGRLNKHVNNVHKKKPMKLAVCDFCSETFRHASSLKCHKLKMHLDQAKFKCSKCQTLYFSEKALVRHEQLNICFNGKRKYGKAK